MRAKAFLFFVILFAASGIFAACGGGAPTRSDNGGSATLSGDRAKRSQAVTIAKRHLGVAYRAGGTNPSTGFDCSGFTFYVFGQMGVTLPRTAAAQFEGLRTIRRPEAGDLVFFDITGSGISHVGIYTGSDTFIHSPRAGKTVEYADMRIDYWRNTYRGARRVF